MSDLPVFLLFFECFLNLLKRWGNRLILYFNFEIHFEQSWQSFNIQVLMIR